MLYLVAMQKTIDGQKRNPGAVYDNPNTGWDPIPAMNPPYSTMYVPLPSIEYLYFRILSATLKEGEVLKKKCRYVLR